MNSGSCMLPMLMRYADNKSFSTGCPRYHNIHAYDALHYGEMFIWCTLKPKAKMGGLPRTHAHNIRRVFPQMNSSRSNDHCARAMQAL